MDEITRIGMDTSKQIFQLHGVDEGERVVVRRKLRRRDVMRYFASLPPVVVAIEACGGSHHWARELTRLGHQVRLLPAQRVKPYVPRGKNDAADAAGLCEAVSRPGMTFVPVKSAEQQAGLMLAGVRDQVVRSRTRVSNEIRGFAAEFGVVAAKGPAGLERLLAEIADDASVPVLARELFAELGQEHAALTRRLAALEARLLACHRGNELSRRLTTIPTVGPVIATLLTLKIPDPHAFRSGRQFAAWLGLTPKDHSTAGKQRLGGITRAGDETLRSLLVVGATAVVWRVRASQATRLAFPWLAALLKRKPPKLVAVALANKTARIAWKLMISGETYQQAAQTAA